MKIETTTLKDRIREKEIHNENDVLEDCYNKGIDTAIKVIEIFEQAEEFAKQMLAKKRKG